jgi:neutral ceramidase
MKNRILSLIGCLLASLCWPAPPGAPAAPAAPQLRAGAATANITPPLGSGIIGGFVPFPATHVHDELHARCLVLDDGQTKLALVVVDLLGIQRNVSAEARRLIQETCKIPPEQVLISATHTHSAASAIQDRYKDQPLEEYQRFVARRIADGVRCAVNNLRPAQIGSGTTEAPEHVFNRRWYLKPGTMPPNPFGSIDEVKMNPRGGSPDLVKPAGPTDPTVSFILLREPNGRPIALFSRYSLHYIGGVGNGHISADYYGVYCRRLAQLLNAEDQDPPFVALMANGTSGDINNINFLHPRGRQQPYEQIRAVAEDLAQKVFRALASVQYRDNATLAARYRELTIASRRPTAEQLEWARKKVAAKNESTPAGDLPTIYAERTLRVAEGAPSIPIPLQVLRIGDVCVGTMPNEVLCEIGLEFKQRSPIQPAFLVSLAHGYFGYLPPPRQHALGGYETWMGTNQLEVHASEKMLDALEQMAAEIK